MNGPTHRLVAGLAVGVTLGYYESKRGTFTARPIAGGLAAALLTNLPDIVAPATSPNHRAFFHSLTFAAILGAGIYNLNQWEPQTDMDRFLKSLGMLAGTSYLIHLALDFTTPRSLPLFGRATF